MAYTKKIWVDVPDPSNLPSIPEGQDSLARFDANNMNRIEEGINESLELVAKSVPTLRRLDGNDVLDINSEGLFYIYNAINVPTSVKSGYIRVEFAHEDFKIVYWRPYNSPAEYSNVKADGVWSGWIETFTNQGGTINGYLANYSEITPGIYFYANKCFAQIVKNASDNVDLGILISDFANKEDGASSANLILSHLKATTSLKDALQFAHVENGKTQYYNILGEHNKPSGTYTGQDQSLISAPASARTIHTGGIGNLLLVISENGMLFVTPQGGVFFKYFDYDTDVIRFKDSIASYADGVLSIEAQQKANGYHAGVYVHDALNEIGYTYTYYCI